MFHFNVGYRLVQGDPPPPPLHSVEKTRYRVHNSVELNKNDRFKLISIYFELISIYFELISIYFQLIPIYFDMISIYFQLISVYFHIDFNLLKKKETLKKCLKETRPRHNIVPQKTRSKCLKFVICQKMIMINNIYYIYFLFVRLKIK